MKFHSLKRIEMKPKPDRRFCNQPDRHEPRIKCGYPLPCPHHTLVIKVEIKKGKMSVKNKGKFISIFDLLK